MELYMSCHTNSSKGELNRTPYWLSCRFPLKGQYGNSSVVDCGDVHQLSKKLSWFFCSHSSSFCFKFSRLFLVVIFIRDVLFFLLLSKPLPVVTDILNTFPIVIIFKFTIWWSSSGCDSFQEISFTLQNIDKKQFLHIFFLLEET